MIRLPPQLLPHSSPSPHCSASCRISTFPHLTPPSREASLSSMALPKDLLVIFTSIANSEETAGAQSQTSSLLQNVRTWGRQGLPVPWEISEMQRWNSSHPFSQGLGFPLPMLAGVLGPGAASSAQGTNTVVRGGQARHGSLLTGTS